jgi:hypothetical protein
LSSGLPAGFAVEPEFELTPGSLYFCFADRLPASGLAFGVAVVPGCEVPGCWDSALPVTFWSSAASAAVIPNTEIIAAVKISFILALALLRRDAR